MDITWLEHYINEIDNTDKDYLKKYYNINVLLNKVDISYDTTKSNNVVICGASDPEMEIIKAFCRKMSIKYIDMACTPAQAYGQMEIDQELIDNNHIVYVEFKPKNNIGNNNTIIDHHNPGDPGYGEDKKHYAFSSLGQFINYFNISFDEETDDGYNLRALLVYAMAADHCLTDAYNDVYPEIYMQFQYFLEYRIYIKANYAKMPFEAVLNNYKNTIEYIKKVNTKFINNEQTIIIKNDSEDAKYLNEIAAIVNTAVIYTMPLKEGGVKLGIIGSNYKNTKQFVDIFQEYKEESDTVYGNPHRGYAGINIKDTNKVEEYLKHLITYMYNEEEQV